MGGRGSGQTGRAIASLPPTFFFIPETIMSPCSKLSSIPLHKAFRFPLRFSHLLLALVGVSKKILTAHILCFQVLVGYFPMQPIPLLKGICAPQKKQRFLSHVVG